MHGGMNLRKAGGRKCGTLQKHKFLHSTRNHFPEFPPLGSVQRKDHSDWFRTGLANAPAVGDPGMLGTLGTLKEQAGRSTCPTTLQILIWVSAIRLVRLPSTRELPYVRMGVHSDHLILFPIERHPQK